MCGMANKVEGDAAMSSCDELFLRELGTLSEDFFCIP
jgi:hypothetical protein